MSPEMEAYFHRLEEQVKEAYDIANAARTLGFDPAGGDFKGKNQEESGRKPLCRPVFRHWCSVKTQFSVF